MFSNSILKKITGIVGLGLVTEAIYFNHKQKKAIACIAENNLLIKNENSDYYLSEYGEDYFLKREGIHNFLRIESGTDLQIENEFIEKGKALAKIEEQTNNTSVPFFRKDFFIIQQLGSSELSTLSCKIEDIMRRERLAERRVYPVMAYLAHRSNLRSVFPHPIINLVPESLINAQKQWQKKE